MVPLIFLAVVWFSVVIPAASADDYADELIADARTQRLAERSEWHNLLHYKRFAWRPGLRSLADDPQFFNAANGKTDPQAELEATLKVFFSDEPETDRTQNPQCRFIARYHWLKQELKFDSRRLPEQPCGRYRRWRDTLNPGAITLVFPAAYLNNPASLYGHTLLRIDARDQDERTRLLSYAINYAAATDETNGLVFAVRGLFGGYPGLFGIGPYYVKVREYNDLENRDIWEYELNFDDAEIERLLMHVWELGPIRFDYFFFDENCSYHLLSLFDVARPGLRLTDGFPAWAIPADTVRAVVEEQGLLRRVTYRPARSTLLQHRQAQLSPEEVALAAELADGATAPEAPSLQQLSADRRAAVLELAFEYLEYQRLTGKRLKREAATETGSRLRTLLLARSAVDAAPSPPVPVPPVRPDEGHGSTRVGITVGSENDRRFTEVRLRPAYHDIYDPEAGYNRGAQIQFFNLVLRDQAAQAWRLERLDLIDIASLSARDALLQPLSWTVNAGLVRKRFDDGDRPLIFRLSGGVGAAFAPSAGSLLYGFVDAALNAGAKFEDQYALGLGPAVGGFVDLAPGRRLGAQLRAIRYGGAEDHDRRDVGLTYAHGDLQRQWRLELNRQREFGRGVNSASLTWYLYF